MSKLCFVLVSRKQDDGGGGVQCEHRYSATSVRLAVLQHSRWLKPVLLLHGRLGSLSVPCCSVAQKTTEQANIIADTAVTGANEVAQSAVEGVENAAMASGLVKSVSDDSEI